MIFHSRPCCQHRISLLASVYFNRLSGRLTLYNSFSPDVNLQLFLCIDHQLLLENMKFDHAARPFCHVHQLPYPRKLCFTLYCNVTRKLMLINTKMKEFNLSMMTKLSKSSTQKTTQCEQPTESLLTGQQWLKEKHSQHSNI